MWLRCAVALAALVHAGAAASVSSSVRLPFDDFEAGMRSSPVPFVVASVVLTGDPKQPGSWDVMPYRCVRWAALVGTPPPRLLEHPPCSASTSYSRREVFQHLRHARLGERGAERARVLGRVREVWVPCAAPLPPFFPFEPSPPLSPRHSVVSWLYACCMLCRVSGAVAVANYSDAINETGWAFLDLATSPTFPSEVQAYAAGYLEAYLSHQRIYEVSARLECTRVRV
jgi:hypothetical protein